MVKNTEPAMGGTPINPVHGTLSNTYPPSDGKPSADTTTTAIEGALGVSHSANSNQ